MIGMAAVLAAGRLIESMLFEVRPAEPVVLITVAALLASAAALASWIPARRVTAGDPSTALRQE
jgi:ABC-type lipoprotein release transport system permease subunit